MANPYLNRDENILLATNRVIVNTITSDAILTEHRLILVDSLHAQFRPQTIPLATIEAAIEGENGAGNPIITLSIAPITGNEGAKPLDLVFLQKHGEKRAGECHDWVKKIKELSVPAREEAIRTGTLPDYPDSDTNKDQETKAPEEKSESAPRQGSDDAASVPIIPRKASPEVSPASPLAEIIRKRSGSLSQHPSAQTPRRKARIYPAIATLVILIVAAVIGVYILSGGIHIPDGQPAATPTMTLTPEPTFTQIVTPTPTQTPVPEQTAISATAITTIPAPVVPETGVWVKIQSDAPYTGSIGTPGRMREVTGSGIQIYQIFTQADPVSISFQKQDGSAAQVIIDVYNNGNKISHRDTTAPWVKLDYQVDLKTT